MGIAPLSREQIAAVLALAKKLAEQPPAEDRRPLAGRRIVTLFFEPSSRTKLSFQIAGRKLGAEVLDFPTATSSVQKGESLKDTALTLEAMGVDAIILRHPSSGAPHYLSRLVRPLIVNAGDGSHEHPTQALLDLLTIQERFGRIEGLTIAMIGDVLHSRVARSNLFAHRKLGNRVLLVGPPTLVPRGFEAPNVEIRHDLDTVLPQVDVAMALRIQQERMGEQFFPSLREYGRLFGLDARRRRLLREGALILHPGPMNRDVEITGAAADSPEAAIRRQVAHGVHVRMAVLLQLLGDGGV